MANTDFQQPTFVWFFRIVQFVFAIIVLGVAGSSISDFTSDGCKSPGKLDFNVAVAVLTMVAMAYLIFSTGKAAFAPFNKWAQLSLDAVFVILWIVCCGTSNYTCDDLCSACYGGDECYCWDVVKKREVKSTLMSRAPVTSVRRASKGSYAKAAGKLGKWASKLGVNVVMLLMFIASLALTAYFLFRNIRDQRRSRNAAVENPAEQEPPVQMEYAVPK